MSLTAGRRLGPYEIVAPLGAGGMGEVYRAIDTRLKREVAIKVLPSAFTEDRERLARFEREAQLLAQLHHPNIAAIHGLEDADGVRALVLELVEGEDLSDLIAGKPMALADALPIARQIADALEAAHEVGIVHRDLKPGNVKVRPDGTVKVLDFGLAKAMDPVGAASGSAAHSPTLTARATQMGMILGTAAYMAPEQARGKAVDRRADIWAFGAVLYEMLTGKRAFEGDDISITLASVLKEDPSWQTLPSDLPAPLRRLLRRCLQKDPRRRLSSIGDARLELDETEPAFASAPAPAPRRLRALPLALGVAAVSILTTAGAMRVLSPAAPVRSGLSRLSVALPVGDVLAETNREPLALSPDGATIAYVGRSEGKPSILSLRKLAERDPVALPGTEGAVGPFFSPDGQWIAFFAGGKLKKVAVDGAGLQIVCDDVPDSRGGAWAPDGTLYFAPTNSSGLWKVPASGGKAAEFTRLNRAQAEISHRWPHVLPDGKSLLFTVWTGPGVEERHVDVQSLGTRERHTLLQGADTPHYLSPGYLVYSRLDDLFAVPWQPGGTGVGTTPPLRLAEHPRTEGEGAAAFALSDGGTLVYAAGGAGRYAQRLVWVDRAGDAEPLPLPARDYESVAISPDGSQAAVQLTEGTVGLWLYDFARKTLRPFVTGGGSSQAPVWTRDGRHVVYRATRNGSRNLYWKPVDGDAAEERLTTKEGTTQTPCSVSPDGTWVLFNESAGPTRREPTLWKLRLSDRTVEPVLPGPRNLNGRISPDGRWLAYLSTDSGQSEVFVRPFDREGRSEQVSVAGGTEPLWSHDGRELFYRAGDELTAVSVADGPTFAAAEPRLLVSGRFRKESNGNTAYDQSPDGSRFLRIQQVEPDLSLDRIDVVLGWGEELQRLAAAK